MLIRYVDGPYEGDTVETTCLEIEGTFIEGDGVVWGVRYRVDRPTYSAREIARYPMGTLPEPVPEPEGLTLPAATTEDLLAELARRAEAGDALADAYLHPRISSVPMRRRRAPMPRAGFGQVPSGQAVDRHAPPIVTVDTPPTEGPQPHG